MPWGYTVRFLLPILGINFDSLNCVPSVQGIFELENGGGLFGKSNDQLKLLSKLDINSVLANEFKSKAAKAIWDFNGTLSPLSP
jgi:hypothetical protein